MWRARATVQGWRFLSGAARHFSKNRASRGLCITQSAVSQKIQALEQELGYELCYRLPRGLRLTHRGERLHIGVDQALRLLGTTLHQIGDEELSGTLKVRVMPSFASKWLLPR